MKNKDKKKISDLLAFPAYVAMLADLHKEFSQQSDEDLQQFLESLEKSVSDAEQRLHQPERDGSQSSDK